MIIETEENSASIVLAQEIDTEQNSEVKIAEVVEDIEDNRESPEGVVCLMFDLFREYGGPWYR